MKEEQDEANIKLKPTRVSMLIFSQLGITSCLKFACRYRALGLVKRVHGEFGANLFSRSFSSVQFSSVVFRVA